MYSTLCVIAGTLQGSRDTGKLDASNPPHLCLGYAGGRKKNCSFRSSVSLYTGQFGSYSHAVSRALRSRKTFG